MTEDVPFTNNTEKDEDFSEDGDITGDGGVIKQIITHGIEGWQKPEDGDDVKMHYRGTLLDGTEFDSSYERGTPFTFKLGDGKVIKGWDVVGKTMAKGEKAKVTLKPEYAYGAAGSPPKIPENATLVFEMELVSWQSKRDVFADGTVIKTELEPGQGWERPGKLAETTMYVEAFEMSEDGKTKANQLHSSEITFTLGSSQVPIAWETVAVDMKKDSVLSLLCKPPHTTGPGIDYVPDDTQFITFQLKLLSWRKIEDIHGDNTLVKKVLKEGTGWERPSEGSEIIADVKFYLSDPDSTLPVPPIQGDVIMEQKQWSFKLGDGIVIDGLDRAIQSMKLNEEAIIFVAPQHAFKTAQNLLTDDMKAKDAQVSSKILLNVCLTKFEKAKDVWGMSFEEKIEEMKVRKAIGNSLFKVGRYGAARKSYDRAVAFFDSPTSELSPELKSQVNELLLQCHLNLAMSLERMGETRKVMNHCNKALEISPSNVKALYRQGCAYLALDDYDNASSTLKRARQLDPNNVDVRKKLIELKNKRAKQDAADKRLYSNLFGRLSKMEEKESKHDTVNGMDVEPTEG